MERGTVKFFDSREHKRFGFIIPDSQVGEVFFHFNNGMNVATRKDGEAEPRLVNGDMRMPKKGDYVVFKSEDSRRGPKATVWAFGADWDRERLAVPKKPTEEVVLGFCPACRKEVALKRCKPRHPDDPMLEDTDFYVVENHLGRHGIMSDCSGSGQWPTALVEDDDLGYDEDGSRFESGGDEEERRNHFD